MRKRRELAKPAQQNNGGFEPHLAGRIADALSASSLVDEAIVYYEAAGDIALSGDEFREAAKSYRRTIALEAQRSRTPSEVLRKLARALQLAGASDEAAEVAQQLVELGGPVASENLARDLGFLGMVSWEGARTDVAYRYVTRAADLGGDSAVQFENLTNAAWLTYEQGNIGKAADLLERAEMLGANVTIETRARFLDVRGRTRLSTGLVDEGFADFRSAVELAERHNTRDLYFALQGNYADNAELVGNFPEADQIWRRLRAKARASHMGWRGPDAALNGARCRLALGDLTGAERLVDSALAEKSSSAVVRIHAAVAGIPVGLFCARNDIIEACADETVIGLALRSKESVRIGPTIAAFCQLAVAQNRLEDARALIDMGMAAIRSADHAHWLLALAAENANMDAARAAQRLIHEAHNLRRDAWSTAFGCYVDAVLLKREGRRREGGDRATAAVILFERLNVPYWRARALELQGSPKEAWDLYRSIGDLYDSHRLGSIFASRRARSGSANALTPRLKEVGSLIAQGLSNREAAQRLGISEKTVNNHLQTIYARLGLTSRAKLIAHFLQPL